MSQPTPRRRFRIFLSATAMLMLATSLAVALTSSTGNAPGAETLQREVDAIARRAREGKASAADKRELKLLYHSMIDVGRVQYPEAATILDHYLWGDGSDLELPADAFRDSPVIQKAIRGRIEGTIGPIWVNSVREPRVAYAVDGFFVTLHTEHGKTTVHMHERIEFDHSDSGKRITTTLRLGPWHLRIPDSLVHLFDEDGGCNAFEVHSHWTER